ncbi:hypothetical protein [Patulibacter minatonensis]|uniref:hypothetical protein n=1 Tax=Patulibacter minatonensis TaxID=298163 RepID=UPI00047C72E1|nr:hypothetical protein [Patulibacter minatonensis]
MATQARLGGRPAAGRGLPSRGDVGLGLLVGVLAVVTAFAVTKGVWIGIVGLIVVGAAWIAGIRDWRRSFVGLLVFLPYSGIFIIAAYPATGPATLLKDLLFVLPLYVGFLGVHVLKGRSVAVRGFPLGLGLAFAGIVVLQMLAPTLPNIVVGLIGAKVWLLYIPLAYVAYCFLRTREDLNLLLTVMAAASVIPCVVGIVEGILVNTGHGDIVYSWYGDAAAAATQQFVNVGVGDATINRVPSTFSFVGQYSLFTIISISVSYAWWRGVLVPRGGVRVWMGPALLGLVALAAFLSGARGTVLAAPALIAVILVLDGINIRTWVVAPVALALVMTLAASIFGTGVGALLQNTWDHAISEFDIGTIQGVEHAFNHTTFGLGTGVDTVSARYALPKFSPYALVGGRVEESWWIKALLELGIIGLGLVIVFVLGVLRAALRAHLSVKDKGLRAISAACCALLAYAVFFNFKGSGLDLDPLNVVFWVFVGIVLRLPVIQEEEREQERRAGLLAAATEEPGPDPGGDLGRAGVRPGTRAGEPLVTALVSRR